MSALLTIKEVQDRLGISESTMFRLLKRKEIKGFKVGRVWKFEEKDIEEYIRQQREKAEAELKEEQAA
jgi:excisionase family DNA binding protein